jgi:hypothetical protein
VAVPAGGGVLVGKRMALFAAVRDRLRRRSRIDGLKSNQKLPWLQATVFAPAFQSPTPPLPAT